MHLKTNNDRFLTADLRYKVDCVLVTAERRTFRTTHFQKVTYIRCIKKQYSISSQGRSDGFEGVSFMAVIDSEQLQHVLSKQFLMKQDQIYVPKT
jgi:hypothetical protein